MLLLCVCPKLVYLRTCVQEECTESVRQILFESLFAILAYLGVWRDCSLMEARTGVNLMET